MRDEGWWCLGVFFLFAPPNLAKIGRCGRGRETLGPPCWGYGGCNKCVCVTSWVVVLGFGSCNSILCWTLLDGEPDPACLYGETSSAPQLCLDYPGCTVLSVQGGSDLAKANLGVVSRWSFVISSIFPKCRRCSNCGTLPKKAGGSRGGRVCDCDRCPSCSMVCLWGSRWTLRFLFQQDLTLWGWDVAEIYPVILEASL